MIEEDEIEVIQESDIEVIPPGTPSAAILQLVQNPGTLQNLFKLDDKQTENVQAILTGTGAAASVKLLSKYVGVEIAGAFGGFLGGYVAKRVLGG